MRGSRAHWAGSVERPPYATAHLLTLLCGLLYVSRAQVSRKVVWARWLLACHRTSPKLAAGIMDALTAECKRAGCTPLLSPEELNKCIDAVSGKPLVDVTNAYAPIVLPIKL